MAPQMSVFLYMLAYLTTILVVASREPYLIWELDRAATSNSFRRGHCCSEAFNVFACVIEIARLEVMVGTPFQRGIDWISPVSSPLRTSGVISFLPASSNVGSIIHMRLKWYW